MGTQSSLMFGLLNGTVVKCTDPSSHAAERAINMTDLNKVCGADLAQSTGDDNRVTHPRAFKRVEEFSAHKDPVIFASFAAGQRLVTLDTRGRCVSI